MNKDFELQKDLSRENCTCGEPHISQRIQHCYNGKPCYVKEPQLLFEYEYIPSKEDLIKQIDLCEGSHVQQAIYSTFHSAITQVCFTEKKIRSTIKR